MTYGRSVVCTAVASVLFATAVLAEPEDRSRNVFDRLFPLSVEPNNWLTKMVLRYSDSNTQLVVVVYSGGKTELIRYHVSVPSGDLLDALFARAAAARSDEEFEKTLAKVSVIVTRSPIDLEALDRALTKLNAICIPPMSPTIVCVDACRDYEFWYENGRDSIHYTVHDPTGKDPQDRLARWMIEFRTKANGLITSPPARVPE